MKRGYFSNVLYSVGTLNFDLPKTKTKGFDHETSWLLQLQLVY